MSSNFYHQPRGMMIKNISYILKIRSLVKSCCELYIKQEL